MSCVDISHALWDDPAPRGPPQSFLDGCNIQMDDEDRLMAAILTKRHDMIPQLLTQLPDSYPSTVFGSFLESAVRMGDGESVRLIKRFLLGLRMNSAGSEAVRDEYLLGRSGFNIPKAISAAAETRNGRILDMLLDFSDASLPWPSHPAYNRRMQAAIRSGDSQILESVLLRHHRPSVQLATATMAAACHPKAAHMMSDLLRKFPNQRLDEGSTMANPLFISSSDQTAW
jgi:hypothetical protein